jgi:hypothetical protein
MLRAEAVPETSYLILEGADIVEVEATQHRKLGRRGYVGREDLHFTS